MANPWEFNWQWDDLSEQSGVDGMLDYGTAPTQNLRGARNADGSVSTLRSISVGEDGKEVLIPTVSHDARSRARVMSDKEAIERYRRTGMHLGKFRDVDSANAFAEELHRDQEQQSAPWTMNWDWGRAEAAAGSQDYGRIGPMVTTGDPSAARYVQQEEYQMPELLHEEPSQRDFVRPKGEMFHARSYVPGAVAEQRVITDDIPWWEVPLRAVARGGEDVVQTGYSMVGGDPREIPTMPLTTMDNPMTVEAAWENPEQAAKQSVTMISRLWPMMAAGYAGAAVSGVGAGAAAGAAGTEILGSSAGAMAATFAQSMGPRFKQMLMQYPDDPERAWKEAGNATLLDVGFTGVGGLLIGAGPLGTTFKQAMFQTFGVKPMAELTGKQLFGNLAFQTLGAQPLVGVANMRAVDYYLGQDTGLTFGDEFLNNLAPSLVQTGAEFAGRAAIAPFSKKTAPGGTPGGGQGEHFIDQIQEATELEKLAADFRTTPEIAAQIPEGLKYQIDNGEDPYRGYRADLQSLNTTLRSKLKETLQTFPEGEKKTGEQWYNTLRNAGVKEEELSDYGLDEMLYSNHSANRERTWTVDQLRGQFHSNDYPIAMRELVPEHYAHGTDNAARYEPIPGGGYESLSTPGIGEYRENLFVLGKDDSTSLTGFAQKRGIDIEALRYDVEAPARGELEVVGAREKLDLLLQEHKAFKDFLAKNPEWKKKHARGEPLDADHWPQDEYGNVLMHTRTGELKFDDDGITSHHIDEIQSDVIQGMEGDLVRDMPEETALAASRYAYDEFSDKLAAERLGDLSYLDDSVRPGVDISAKFDTLLESLGVETDKPYAWLTEARDKLIKFHDDPGSFSLEARQKISSIIDPDRLPPIINKMRKDSARAQELVGEVLQVKNYAQAPASVPLRKSWSKAGLKAEIQRALSLGKKHISWTSGAVQMHRNDTGHRIGSLSATRESKGYYTVHVDGMNGRELLHRRHATAADIKKEFGDDLGSKLIKRVDESKGGYVELTQEEIGGATLGGKFHRKLYDEKMVQWAREIGKKFGKTPELKMYTAPDGTSHEMWVMELDPRMSGTMFRYQVGSEERNLIAVRQMSVDALRKAIELGGIPMPSLAIIKADNGLSALSSFSDDVTLVGSRDLVDPEKGALAYDSDIYSPGTPATRYVVDPVARTKLEKKLQGLAKELKAPGITDDVVANVAKSGLVALSDTHAVVVQFARDMKHLKGGEKVMNSDGEGVTRLREWALAHPEFRGWLNSNFGKMIATKKALWKDAKFGRKEKLSPFTLDSMLRIMESKPIKGANTKSASVAYYRGLAAKKFGSIAEIKAESGKLLPREQTEAMFSELQEDFERTVEFMSRRAAEWSGEPYEADIHMRVAQNFIKEVLQSKGSAKRIAQVFGEGVNATDIKEATDLIKRIDGTATSYFEVKVPGIVNFDRFAAAIVRSDRLSPDEIQALRDLGVKEIAVVRGDDQVARDLALNGLKHLRFQVGEQAEKQVTQAASDTRKVSLTQKQQKQFRKLMANLVSEIKRINPLADVRFLDRFIGFSEDGTAISVNGISHLLGIGVGIGDNKDPFGTARHEAGHTVMWLMDNLKAWKPGEREALVEWFENTLATEHAQFLKHYKPEQRFEEAIVQELGVNRNKWKGYPQALRNALYRIDGILKAIRTAVKRAFGRKLSPQDIAAMFDAGIMARRAIRKMRRLEGKTRGTTFARTADGSLAYQVTRETLRDTVFSSQLDNTLYGKVDNPEIGTKLKKGSGSQWRAELIKQGVKLEELKDSGLDEYLTENASKPMTLQDIIDFREKNRIELHMVMLDDGSKSYTAPPEEDPLAETKKKLSVEDRFYDSLRAENVLSMITGRPADTYGGINGFITSKVRDGVQTMARQEIRSNPEKYDTNSSDPRRTAYIYDAKDDVLGRLVVFNKGGKAIDFGWIDPLNQPWRMGFDKKRTPQIHRKILDRMMQELLDTLQPLYYPETEDSVEIREDNRGENAPPNEKFYAEVVTTNGRHVDTITGPTREEVKTKFWDLLNRRRFEHRFEYKPYEGERYIPVNYNRGGHDPLVMNKTNDLADLQQRVDRMNDLAEQQWTERMAGQVYYTLAKDGELLNKFAKEAMLDLIPENERDSAVRQHDELLTAAASFSMAGTFTTPETLAVPYPAFDRFRWREWKNAQNALSDGLSRQSSTRFSTWSLPGGNLRREVLITAPDLPRGSGESLHTHFGDYQDENVVVHTRLAEFYVEDGSVMNLADENQSDAMQRASEAREDLIKTYGFKARPDLAFDREGHQAEWDQIRADAKVQAKQRGVANANRRPIFGMVHEMADSLTVGIESEQIPAEQVVGLTNFAKKYLKMSMDESGMRWVSDIEYAADAARFIRSLVSYIEINFSDEDVTPVGLKALDESIRAAVGDTTGTSKSYIDNGAVQVRNDTLAMLRSIEVPESFTRLNGPRPENLKNMHDALFFLIGAYRRLSRSLTSLGSLAAVAYDRPDLPNVRFAPKRTPHKKSWGLMAFKFALWDAVQRGHKWVGFTTGEQQNERYASTLRKGVERMKFDRKGDKADVNIKLKNGETKKLSKVTRHELARYIGRGAADQVFNHPDASGELTGDNIMFNLPGVMDHYDKGLPKEIKPLLEQFGMKIVMKNIGQMVGNEFKPLHEVYGIEITPKAEKAAKSGEIFRYQVREDDLSGTLESQLDTALMPDSPARTKLKRGTGAQWRAELTKQGVKLEELRDSGLDDYFTEYKDQQLSIDQVFQARQGNRIDVVMKVLDDGTEPLVELAKKVGQEAEEPGAFDFAAQLDDEYGVRVDTVDDRFREIISEWVGEDDNFDSRENPRYPYEARRRNEIEYELVRYLPDGDIDETIENYGDDYHYAKRTLRDRYHSGEKEYAADAPSQEGDEWVVVIRDDFGDGNVVNTIRGDNEEAVVAEAEHFIKEESPYYGIHDTETDDWGVWDHSEDKWEETGFGTSREAERSAESSNDHHFEYWVERAEQEAWEQLRGDIDEAQEKYEEALERELTRQQYNELRDLPGYEESIRAHLNAEFSIGGRPGQSGKPGRTDSTKFGSWVLKGGRYYREYVLTTPDLSDQGISIRTHFENVSRKVMGHFRASDFYTKDGGVAVVSQEFQSDVHQDASGLRQDLIKKVGIEPSPSLGYGYVGFDKLQEAKERFGDQRDNLVDNRNTLRDNFDRKIRDPLLSIFDSIPDEELARFTPDGEAPSSGARADLRIGMYHIVDEVLRLMDSDLKYGRAGNRYNLRELFTVAYDRAGRHFSAHLPGISQKSAFGLLIDTAMRRAEPQTGLFPGAQNLAQEWNFYMRLIRSLQKNNAEPAKKLSELNKIYPASPERLPHKQSWLLTEFKILLHEAIKNGYDWIGLTTGDQQVERYGSALREAISGIDYDINRETGKANIVIGLNRKDPHKMNGVTEDELARYIGKKAASDVFNSGQDKGRIDGSGVQFKSPGILNHYDRAIQSETKKFLASLDMKWEPLEIGRRIKTVSTPEPQQSWKLIQRGTRPDGTIQEAEVVRNTREEIEQIMQNANNLANDPARLSQHGFTAYSHELVEPTATNLPVNEPQERFETLHTVHGIKISDKARMWMQGSPEQPTKRFLKYQVETPDHKNDPVRERAMSSGRFRKWFEGSVIADAVGRPIKMFHGSLSDITAFVSALPSGFWGAGQYFTSSPRDASQNYADPLNGFQRQKRERYIERNREMSKYDPEEASRLSDEYDQKMKIDNDGVVYPVYLSIKNPVNVGFSDIHGNLTGPTLFASRDLDRFKNYFAKAAAAAGAPENQVAAAMAALNRMNIGNTRGPALFGNYRGATILDIAAEIAGAMRPFSNERSQQTMTNSRGEQVLGEAVRSALQSMGYDGIVDTGVSDRFKGMGLGEKTFHAVAFDGAQVKSVNNKGNWGIGVKDIRYQVEHHDTPEFKRFFGKSIATRDGKVGGEPLRLYRGQHGETDGDLQSGLPSITFTEDPTVSSEYALFPNKGDDRKAGPKASMNIAAYLRIENPLWDQKGDPFISFGPLIKKLGRDVIEKLLDDDFIYNSIILSNYWEEEFYPTYGDDLRSAIKENPGLLEQLDVEGFRMLDDHDFVAAAKAKGYDGAIQAGTGVGHGTLEYRIFDEKQAKSAIGNRGTYDPDDPRLHYQIELPDGLTHADPAVNTPRFKVWFKKSKIIDAVGHPLRVFHGSLKAFTAFNSSWGTNEGFFGRRFYFTNHPGDASDNYASRKGPDNQYKMNKYLDQEVTADEADYWSQMDNEGVVYPVYLSIQNPVIVGSSSETRFGYRDMLRLAQAAKHAEKLVSIFEGYGTLSDVITEIMTNETPGSGDYIPAGELIKRIREHDGIYEIIDENGDNAYSEVLRQAFETLGYDGIVDYGVNSRWKWIKHQNVEHFIAFRPNQIKSVFNRGTWSSRLDDIHYQVSTDDPVKSPKFRAWYDGALLQTADGEPLPVYHATGGDFDKFRRAKGDIGIHIGTVGQANERYLTKAKHAEEHSDDTFRPSIMKLYTNIRNPLTMPDTVAWDVDSIYRGLFRKWTEEGDSVPIKLEDLTAFARQYQNSGGDWKPGALYHLKRMLVSKGFDSIVYYNGFEKEGQVAAERAYNSAKEKHIEAIEARNPGRSPWNVDPMDAPVEWAAVLRAERELAEIRKQQVPSYIAFWPTQLKSVFNRGTWSGKMRSVMYQTQWEDAPQSSSFLDSLREGFSGEWEGLDEEASLSSDEVNLRKVYRKDWLDMRKGPNQFQFALMFRGQPIGRINGVINGDTARINWLGIIGGDEGLGDGAIRHLGAMLRLALPNEVRLLTGLRKGPEEAYAAEEQKTAKKPAPSGPSATKVRTPGGSQEDPLIEYYRNLGRYQ